MSKALISSRLSGVRPASFRISLVGLFIILAVFAGVLPYVVKYESKAFMVLTTLAMAGISLGLLAGGVRFDLRFDPVSLAYGLLGAGVVGASAMLLRITSSLSVTGFVLVYSAVAEELAFRFGVLRFAERIMSVWFAVVFQAGLFMLYHWMVYPGYSLTAAYPLIAGLVFGWIDVYANDLTPSLLAHVMVNVLVAISLG